MIAYINIDKIADKEHKIQYNQALDSLRHEVDRKDSIMLSYDRRLSQIHQLNWDNIDFWLTFFSIDYPDIVKRQIYLETGNLQSKMCLENHNLFGMKYPGKGRITTALGTRNGHSYYNNYIASIYDYALWQHAKKRYENEDYYQFLERVGYAEDKKYIQLLKSIPDSVFN